MDFPFGAPFSVPPDLRDSCGAEDPDDQRAADRCEQQRHAEGDVASESKPAHLHALGVFEDEDQQQDQDDQPGHEAAERRGYPRARRLCWKCLLSRGLRGGGLLRGASGVMTPGGFVRCSGWLPGRRGLILPSEHASSTGSAIATRDPASRWTS